MSCPSCGAQLAVGSRFCGTCGRAAIGTAEVVPSMAGDSAPSLIGREIVGRYRIKTKLGEGGMGAVFKAEQISLKRVVALKLLKPELVSSAPLLRRFNAEAEAVAKLNHPNTVGIYDFGQDSDGTLFIAMEYVEGKSLRAMLIAEGPFSAQRALPITGQIAASLSDAHAVGIIHRDLKPDNIMLQERGRQRDVVRVLDFGIAKLRDDSRMTQQSMTQAGDVLGTPQYMSPEQIRGEEIDGRADVYSLGAMLYEMLTGRMVFEAGSLVALLSKHLLDQPEPPSRRRPDLRISPELDELVMSCLAKEPKGRLGSMDQLAEAVARLMSAATSDAPAVPMRGGEAPSGLHGAGGNGLPAAQIAPTGSPLAGASTPPPTGPASQGGFAPPTPPPPGPASYGGVAQQPTPPPVHASPFGPPYGQPAAPGPYPGPYGPPSDGGYGAYSPHAGYAGYAAGQAPAYVPYPPHAPAPAPAPPRPAGSMAGLIVAIVALVALAGGGAYYFLVYKKDAPAVADTPSGPGSGSADSPWGGGSGSASPWGSGAGSSGSGNGAGSSHGGDDDDPAHLAHGNLNKPLTPPKIGSIGTLGGKLYSAAGFFRLLVPPELSPNPKMESTPDGSASLWTFSAAAGTGVAIAVMASPMAPEVDEDDPGETVRTFGMSLGMAMQGWQLREIGGGQRALSGTFHATPDGDPAAVEAVLYPKTQGFLVVMFFCAVDAFDDSEEYRDILFKQRISW